MPSAYPDTLVGTDSHTTMVNGLGVLGWGVGGIEAEAAMLGQPMSMLIPRVLGFKLHGELPEGATATDLVLTVTEMLRERGVVGHVRRVLRRGPRGPPARRPRHHRQHVPEFGSTCAIFPVDAETLRYLELSGRPKAQIELVEAYCREQGLWHDEHSEEPTFSELVELDLGEVVPSIAGPKRPQDRIALTRSREAFREALGGYLPDSDGDDDALGGTFPASDPTASQEPSNGDGARDSHAVPHGAGETRSAHSQAGETRAGADGGAGEAVGMGVAEEAAPRVRVGRAVLQTLRPTVKMGCATATW